MERKLRFGIGGLPHTAKKGVVKGIERLRELGLEHMELEFVQSVFVSKDKAPEVKAAAEANDITLSVHGSYYTNFASEDKAKWYASINRITSAAEVGAMCGAKSVTYHSGFFQGESYDAVKPRVVEAMAKVLSDLNTKGAEIRVSPELTGKAPQVGDLPELIDLVRTVREAGFTNANVCIDFAHKYARTNGQFNTYDEFTQMLTDIKEGLGGEYLENLHIHVSGIEHSPKGEKNHLTFLRSLDEYKEQGIEVEGIEPAWAELPLNRLEPNKFNWQDLLKALKDMNVGGFIVCESPVLELDALLMQQYYHKL